MDVWRPQQYDGNALDPTMAPSDFTFTSQSVIIFNNSLEEHDNSISGAVVQQTSSVPEPGTLALLFAGLAGLGLLVKMRG